MGMGMSCILDVRGEGEGRRNDLFLVILILPMVS